MTASPPADSRPPAELRSPAAPRPPAEPRPPAARARRRSLHRTIASIAVAALVAAWLPFTAFYVSALQPRPVIQTVAAGNGTRVITTRTSTGQLIRQTVPAGSAAPAPAAPAPATRSS